MKGEGNDVCLQCTCVRCSQILEYVWCDRLLLVQSRGILRKLARRSPCVHVAIPGQSSPEHAQYILA